jgi:hypothetical protein
MRSSRRGSGRAAGLKLTPTRTRSSSWAATANRSGAASASYAAGSRCVVSVDERGEVTITAEPKRN